jgi:hypothetical protein
MKRSTEGLCFPKALVRQGSHGTHLHWSIELHANVLLHAIGQEKNFEKHRLETESLQRQIHPSGVVERIFEEAFPFSWEIS